MDGFADTSLNTVAIDSFYAIAVPPDGKRFFGGWFTTMGGVINILLQTSLLL